LLAITEIDLNGPSASIVVEDLGNLHVRFAAEKGMPILFIPAHKHHAYFLGKRQRNIYIRGFDLPGY
jgi:hypothetical protein